MADLSKPAGSPPSFQLFSGLDDLPLEAGAERDVTLLLEREWNGLVGVLRSMYPASIEAQVPDRAGDVLYQRVLVPASARVDLQGLIMRPTGAEGGPSRRVADPAARPADVAGDVEWSGGVFVQRSGNQAMVERRTPQPSSSTVRLPASVAISIADCTRCASSRRGQRADGLHLFWTEAGSSALDALSPGAFVTRAPESGHGLLGRYFRGDRWEGQPLFSRIDPLILFAWREQEPISGPFSVSWLGELAVPRDGSYGFQVDSDDGAQLWIDDRQVGAGLTPDRANFFEVSGSARRRRRRIRLNYFQRGGAKSVQLRWSPPNGPAASSHPSFSYPLRALPRASPRADLLPEDCQFSAHRR